VSAQLGLMLAGGSGAIPEPLNRGELGDGDALPPGPYTVGLTHWQAPDGTLHDGMPYTVVCATGQAVAGHVPSREIAEAIAVALNFHADCQHADSVGSYLEAVRAIGADVKAGRRELPEFFRSEREGER
jgi:hypothetical protein